MSAGQRAALRVLANEELALRRSYAAALTNGQIETVRELRACARVLDAIRMNVLVGDADATRELAGRLHDLGTCIEIANASGMGGSLL